MTHALVLMFALAAQQGDEELLLNRAYDAFRRGPKARDEARALFQQYLRAYPASESAPEVMLDLARRFDREDEGDRRAALQWIRDFLVAFPQDSHREDALELAAEIGGWRFTSFPSHVAPGLNAHFRAKRSGRAPSRYVYYRRPGEPLRRHFEAAGFDDSEPDLPRERWERVAEERIEWILDRDYDHDMSVPLAKPGLYHVVETIDGFTRVHTLYVTTYGVLAKALAGRVVVFAYDPWSGKPLEGIDLKVRTKEKLLSGKSGADGIASFDVRGVERVWILASRDDEVHTLPLDLDSPASESLVFITTDRPVYRPGQTVQFKAVRRDRSDEKLRIPPGEKVRVEVRDPEHRLLQTTEHDWNDLGSLSGSFRLADEPPIGEYRVVVRVKRYPALEPDGSDWSRPFRVAAYRKPEVKVTVTFPGGAPVGSGPVKALIRAEYYFGGPAADANVEWAVRRRLEYPQKDWPRPPFEDPRAWFYLDRDREDSRYDYEYEGEFMAQGQGKTGPDGALEIPFSAEAVPGALATYVVDAQVVESSRMPARGSGQVVVSSSALHIAVGTPRMFYRPGDRMAARVRVTTPEGKPVADRPVELIAFLDTGDEAAEFESFFSAKSATDAAGYAGFDIPVDRGGRLRLRVRAKDDAGRVAEDRADLWSAGDEVAGVRAGDFEVRPDRAVYEEGETIRIMVRTAAKPLDAFLTVESGTITEARVVTLGRFCQVLEIPARAEFVPNVVVRLAAWKDGAPYGGGCEVFVYPKGRFIDVAVTSDRATYAPRTKARVMIDTKVPAEVELAIIDESILAIRPDLTRDIRSFFHPRRDDLTTANGTGTWIDGYYSLAGGRGMVLTGATFALEEESHDAGDSGGDTLAPAETRRWFPDTLHWNAHLRTGPDGKATVEIETPDSMTSWRVLVRAVAGADRFGWGLSGMVTRKDVIVRLVAPRFYTERDQGTVSTIVHNDRAEAGEFTVRLRTEGGEGGGERKVSVPARGQKRIDWTVRAVRPGTMKLHAEALSRVESDAMELDVPVKPHGLEAVRVASGRVADAWKASLDLPADAPAESASLEVTVASGPASAILQALPFLAGYPYGCVEQTMSRFLPAVTAGEAMKRLSLPNETLEKSLPDMVNAGLQRLYGFQHEDGGWGWWKEDRTHPFMTAYALFGLVSARRAGFAVDPETVKRGVDALLGMERTPFALYVLSLAGADVAEALRGAKPQSPEDSAYLALAGRKELAATLPVRPPDLRGSIRIQTTGLILRALASVDPADPRIDAYVERLLAERRGPAWWSTLDSAWAVYGLAEAARGGREPEFVVRVNGREAALTGGRVRLTGDALRKGANEIDVAQKGGRLVFASALLRFFSGREEGEPERGSIEIVRKVFRERRKGDDQVELEEVTSGSAVRVGERLLVTLRASSATMTDYVMIESPIAAGTEPLENEPWDYEWWNSWYGRRELRDDRVSVAATFLDKEMREFSYRLLPTLPGEYHILPALAFGMYDPDRRGASTEFRLRIVD